MKNKFYKSLSFYTVIGLLIYLTWFNFTYRRWDETKIIVWDIVFYYEYLPASFIHHDLSLSFLDHPKLSEEEVYYYEKTQEGKKFIKTTIGMSILYSPFFWIAHEYTKAHGTEEGLAANGYTYHYQKAIFLSALFYLVFGLFFFRALLLLFYNEWITSIIAVIVIMGTNLFHYVTNEAAMPHVYNFSFITAFLYFSCKWHESKSYKMAIGMGLVGGLTILIRPINIFIFMFPVLYGVKNWDEFKDRFNLLIHYWRHIILIIVIVIVFYTPQLVYWKMITGHLFYNSYGEERFFLNHPHIIEGLFSYRKGWLVYTPLMSLAILGIVFLYKIRRDLFLAVTLFTCVIVYFTFSWWAWWYGGGFSCRPLIDFYSIFALSIASVFQYLYDYKKLVWSHILTPIILFLIYLNLFQSEQYRGFTIHYDSMTKEAYWMNFLKKDCIEWTSYEKMLKAPDYDKAKKGEEEYSFNPF